MMPKGTALVARGAVIQGGTQRLVIPRPRFLPAHTGSILVAPGLGPLVNGYRQHWTTQIVAVHSPTEITTKDVAQADGLGIRIVWGPDSTAKIANVLDDLASIGGGRCQFDGHYLLRGAVLPTRDYSGIWLAGAGRQTVLEQFDATVDGTAYCALLAFGYGADNPAQDPNNDWLRDVGLSDMTIRQLPNMTNPVAIVATRAVRGMYMERLYCTGGYEGVVWGGKSLGLTVRDVVIEGAGLGGPARQSSNAGLNVIGHDVDVKNVEILGCGQGMEIASHRGRYKGITIDAKGVNVNPAMGVNLGSSSQGLWENELVDVSVRDYQAAISISNVNGTADRTHIIRPRIHNGEILVRSGKDANDTSVAVLDPIEGDTVIHGRTIIRDPEFTYDEGNPTALRAPFQFGERGNPAAGREEVIVERASVFLPQDCTVAPAFVVFADYSAHVRCVGTRVYGPPGAKDIDGAFRLDMGTTPLELLTIDDHRATFDWRICPAGAPPICLPANTSYSR